MINGLQEKHKLVIDKKIEVALLVVKTEIYDKVILLFEMWNHVIVKVDQ